MVSDQALLSLRPNRCRNDFLPYSFGLKYELPLNVFSFGCIVCHGITQIWPDTNQDIIFRKKMNQLKSMQILKSLLLVGVLTNINTILIGSIMDH